MAGVPSALQLTGSNIDRIFPSIDDHKFSDRVCDASIEKRVVRSMSRFVSTLDLGCTGFGATNSDDHVRSDRIAIAGSTCLFDRDAIRTQAITKGSS